MGEKEYYKNNKGKWVEYSKTYRQKNREKRNQESMEWRANNREHVKEYNKQWHKNNVIKSKESTIQWYKNNPERTREIRARTKSKRRGLGFNILNKYFKDSVAHHINKDDVVYIPKEIHCSIWHRLKTGKNMGEINLLAMEYIL